MASRTGIKIHLYGCAATLRRIALRTKLLPMLTGTGSKRGYAKLFHNTVLQGDEGRDFDFD